MESCPPPISSQPSPVPSFPPQALPAHSGPLPSQWSTATATRRATSRGTAPPPPATPRPPRPALTPLPHGNRAVCLGGGVLRRYAHGKHWSTSPASRRSIQVRCPPVSGQGTINSNTRLPQKHPSGRRFQHWGLWLWPPPGARVRPRRPERRSARSPPREDYDSSRGDRGGGHGRDGGKGYPDRGKGGRWESRACAGPSEAVALERVAGSAARSTLWGRVVCAYPAPQVFCVFCLVASRGDEWGGGNETSSPQPLPSTCPTPQ